MVKKNHKYCCRYRTCGTDTECRRAVEDMEKLKGSRETGRENPGDVRKADGGDGGCPGGEGRGAWEGQD